MECRSNVVEAWIIDRVHRLPWAWAWAWAVAKMTSNRIQAWWAARVASTTNSSNNSRCLIGSRCSNAALWHNLDRSHSKRTTWLSRCYRTLVAHSSSNKCLIWWTSNSTVIWVVTNSQTWWWAVDHSPNSNKTISRICLINKWTITSELNKCSRSRYNSNRCNHSKCSSNFKETTPRYNLNNKCSSKCSHLQTWCSSSRIMLLNQVWAQRVNSMSSRSIIRHRTRSIHLRSSNFSLMHHRTWRQHLLRQTHSLSRQKIKRWRLLSQHLR